MTTDKDETAKGNGMGATALIDHAQKTIAEAVSKHGRVALFYSGGLDSCVLLHIARPWRERIKVFTARTGAEFGHMAVFLDNALTDWDHTMVRTDVLKSIREYAIPSSVVPILNLPHPVKISVYSARLPKITDAHACCSKHRWKPMVDAVEQEKLTVTLLGQRALDFFETTVALPPGDEPGVFPLWPGTRDDVWAVVKKLDVEIPEHYSEIQSSLDCSVCPAELNTARRAYMQKHYPIELRAADALKQVIVREVANALSEDLVDPDEGALHRERGRRRASGRWGDQC